MRRLICWLRGHLWDSVAPFPDERLHGRQYYALPDCKCERCGVVWRYGLRGQPEWKEKAPTPPTMPR